MNVSGKNARNRYIFAAFFAALIAVSGFFIVPLPAGVPIVLKNMFVVLSGVLLGGPRGCLAVLIFVAAGLAGIPVFVIPGGPGVFLTPLGGYILGYIAASLLAGLISGIPKVSEKKVTGLQIFRIITASFFGFALILFCGSFYMTRLNALSLKAAIAAGTIPFLLTDAIKLFICVPLALRLRPIVARYINGDA